MGKSAPPSQDYRGAALETAEAGARINRPNQANAFGSTTQWSIGPDGTPQVTQGFGGPFAGLATGLQQQAAQAGASPLDFSQFGELGTGDTARQQAIDAAYGQSASRLNPMFEQREAAERSRLLNAGIPEGSQAFNTAMGNFARERNDAFQGALNSAIGQGTQAGQAVFQQNLQGRQQAISEALRRRGQPLQELQALQGFLGQPNFAQAAGPNLLGAAQAQDQYGLDAWRLGNEANADVFSGVAELLGGLGKGAAGAASLAPLLAVSDERAKEDVHRLPLEVLPGVPLATWRYRPGYGPDGVHVGVIAQDLERVAPAYVSRRADGMRLVNYAFLETRHA